MAVRIIGVMSGSSLDGLDLALCRFDGDPGMPAWEILDTEHVDFSADWRERLFRGPELTGMELMHTDAAFGQLIGQEVLRMMRRTQSAADLIASHGHTVFHEPAAGFTTQIGNGAWIAALTGVDTVTSFRGADVALGGQGAPFVPAADIALFPQFEGYLNLGGIANVHLRMSDGSRRAWDIGPCNQPLNDIASQLNLPYDPDGRIARSGRVDDALVQDLLSMFPARDGKPKGMSNAEVRNSWIRHIRAIDCSIPDKLASTTEAVARMITAHIHTLSTNTPSIMVTGGGAHNGFLMERLRHLGHPLTLRYITPPDLVVDFKECLLMAFLGYHVMHRRPFGLARLTGASRESIGGAYYFGRHES